MNMSAKHKKLPKRSKFCSPHRVVMKVEKRHHCSEKDFFFGFIFSFVSLPACKLARRGDYQEPFRP